MRSRLIPGLFCLFLLSALWMPLGTDMSAAARLPAQGRDALTRFLQDAVARGDVPGIVVGIVNQDGPVYLEAFGVQNAARKIAMSRDAIFNIASMTKPITSAGVMLLVQQEKIRIDEPVATYLPQFRDRRVITRFNAADASYETRAPRGPITIRHLLTHTSGIGYSFSNATVAAIQRTTKMSETDMPLLFEPGEGWAYGASTRALGQLIEKVSGEKLDAFLTARLLRPLGMQDTSYAVAAEKVSRVASTNRRVEGAFAETAPGATVASPVQGDGGLYSTAADYGRFLQMLVNDGRIGSTKIMNPDTVRTMFRNHTGSVVVEQQVTTNPGLSASFPLGAGEDVWGLGFQLSRPKARKPNTRSPGSGTWAGIFNTHFWVDPTKRVGVVVMTQVLPFYDDRVMQVLGGIEDRLYQHLK
jgi:CubicO group peptidase (beta-lactamase class C family)